MILDWGSSFHNPFSFHSLSEAAFLWDWNHDSCAHAMYLCISPKSGVEGPQCVYVRQTPRLNRKRQETLIGDSECTLASACALSEDQVCLNIFYCRPNPCKWLHRPGQCGWQSYLPLWCHVCPCASALHACLNLLCGNQCSLQPNLTTQAEGRRYNVHAELLRQKNKYREKRKGSLLKVRGAAGRRCETGKPSCFRNLNAPLLRTSNMCLYEGAITQFQDLALCINLDQHNLTHCSDDVRLIGIKWKFGIVCKCAFVCLILRIRCLGVFLLSKSNKQRKVVSKVEWKHIDISCMSLHVSMCVWWSKDDITGWAGSRQRSSGQYESRLCHTDADRLHAMLTTELSATGRGLSTGWRCSAKACQICGSLNVSVQ